MAPIVVGVGQAFKESLSVGEVAAALGDGVRAAGGTPRLVLGSDGGDGLLDAVRPPRRHRQAVTGPLGTPVTAEVGWLEDDRTVIVESRLACGLSLVPRERRDPLVTTTRGVGELVRAAITRGARHVLVGLGGSATMDGGVGMARAWGWRALDEAGRDLEDGGGALERLTRLEPGDGWSGVRLTALTDVRNTLLGADGAAVYAAQKGADARAVARLRAGLARLVAAAAEWNGRALAKREGAGAAGGVGFGLLCFGGADLVGGAAWVLERNDLRGALDGASLLLIAEGGFDATSLAGKLTGEAIARAGAAGVPVAVLTPRAAVRPVGVGITEESGWWTTADLARHAERAVRSALRLPPP